MHRNHFRGAKAGPGRRHGFSGGRHGGRGRHRLFEAGEMRLVFLRLLEGQPRHGYDFMREIEALTGGAYAPSPGIVYPLLTLLDDLGHITEARAAGMRRLFTIAPAGQAYLDERRAEAEAALARLSALGTERQRVEAGPVRRAMENLKTVLQQRLAESEADRQVLLAAADLIDEAARRIERL